MRHDPDVAVATPSQTCMLTRWHDVAGRDMHIHAKVDGNDGVLLRGHGRSLESPRRWRAICMRLLTLPLWGIAMAGWLHGVFCG